MPDKSASIFVAGHKGLIGSAIMRKLQTDKYSNIITKDKSELELTDSNAVDKFFAKIKPEYVLLAAGRTGGIMENKRIPADFMHINLAINLNVLKYAHEYGVKKLVYFCSSCMYPSPCAQPMQEDSILSGRPDRSVYPMAFAKLASMQLGISYNQQYGKVRFIPVIPTSAYGPNDDFNPATGHVLSALIHKFHEAKINNAPNIELWGSGKPYREFIHADDVANAAIMLLDKEISDANLPINIGVGKDYTIAELANVIKLIIGYNGAIIWNTEKPDGAARKLLDSTRISKLGWQPSIGLEEGIRDTYEWYLGRQ